MVGTNLAIWAEMYCQVIHVNMNLQLDLYPQGLTHLIPIVKNLKRFATDNITEMLYKLEVCIELKNNCEANYLNFIKTQSAFY